MTLPSEQTPGPDHSATVSPYEVVSAGTVEPKVKAGAAGAGAGAVVSAFVLWGLDELFWNGAEQPDVPLPVTGFVTLVITSGMAFVSAYYARHVNRA